MAVGEMRIISAKGNTAIKVASVALSLFFCLPVFQSLAPIVRIAYVVVFFVIFLVTSPYSVMLTLCLQSLLIFLFLSATYFVKGSIEISFFQDIFLGFWFWIPFIMMISLSKIHDLKFHKVLINIVLYSLVISSVTTIIGLIQFPYASRQLATGRNDLYSLKFYQSMNIGGYGFIYSLVLFLPILFGDLKFNIINRVLKLTSIILFYICIIVSQYTMAAILSIVLPLLVVILMQKHRTFMVLLTIAISIIVVIFLGFFWTNFIEYLNSKELYFLVNRFDGLYQNLRFGLDYSGLSDRQDLYYLSLFSFLRNPLFGGLINPHNNVIGGHSSILDVLGSLGIIGGLFISNIVYEVNKNQPKSFYHRRIISVKVMWFGFIILALVNTVLSSFTLSVVIFVISLSYLKLVYLKFPV